MAPPRYSSEPFDARYIEKLDELTAFWDTRFSKNVGAPMAEIEEKPRPMIPSLGSWAKLLNSCVTAENAWLFNWVQANAHPSIP